MRLSQKTKSSLNDMSIFSFNYSIMLGCMWIDQSMVNSMICKILGELSLCILSSNIGLKLFNLVEKMFSVTNLNLLGIAKSIK